MKCFTLCRLVGMLVLLGAAAVASAHAAAAGDEQEMLQPGKTPGTFHLIYHGTVGFTMKPEFPTVVSIKSEVRAMVAKRTVTDGKPFTLEADLPPGVYWVESAPLGQPALSDYQTVNGGQLVIDPQGRLLRQMAPIDSLIHVHTMSGLSPAGGSAAGADPAVLRWTKVEGAKFYRGTFTAGGLSREFKTESPFFDLPRLPAGESCFWEVWAQDQGDQTIASGFANFRSHGAAPQTYAPNIGFIGVSLTPFMSSGNSSGATAGGRGSATSQPGEAIPCLRVTDVVPDSPASKVGVRVGDLIIAVNGKPAARAGRAAVAKDVAAFVSQTHDAGPGEVMTLTLRRDGKELKQQITTGSPPGWLTWGTVEMSGLLPDNLEIAGADPTVLKWTPVAGAKRYQGAFRSGELFKSFETGSASYTLPNLHPPDQCDWWVCAVDDKGDTLASSRASFLPHGTDPAAGVARVEAFMVPESFLAPRDADGMRRIVGGAIFSPREMIPCIWVLDVTSGSPAQNAGIVRGDWIIALDGKLTPRTKFKGIDVGDPHAFVDQIRAIKPGTVVTLTIRRDSKELKIPVTVASAPGRAKSPATQPNAPKGAREE